MKNAKNKIILNIFPQNLQVTAIIAEVYSQNSPKNLFA